MTATSIPWLLHPDGFPHGQISLEHLVPATVMSATQHEEDDFAAPFEF
jgi:hypothetical protein